MFTVTVAGGFLVTLPRKPLVTPALRRDSLGPCGYLAHPFYHVGRAVSIP